MFEWGLLASVIVWPLSGAWLLISLLRVFIPKWRRSGIGQAKYAVSLFVLSFVAILVCNQLAYLDYGLASREGLDAARAARKAEKQTQAAAEKATAAKLAEESALKQVEADRQKAEADAQANKAKAQQAAVETAALEQQRRDEQAAAATKICTDTIGAFVMSQGFVKRALKAPSTAEFPWFNDRDVGVTPLKGCAYRVVAWVDAQNGFGAQIRSRYVVGLTFREAEGSWQMTDIRMD